MRKNTYLNNDLADPVRDAMTFALERILEPLLELTLDTGLTVKDISRIIRTVAVHSVMKRSSKENGRLSKSRVAIVTGLPRSEVARLISLASSKYGRQSFENPARRVLIGWHDDPSFLSPQGNPLPLPIFGKKRSFQRLVSKYGAGMPIRALLDELVQLNAAELMEGQRVRAISRIPFVMGLNSRSVAALGERVHDLLNTLIHNIRNADEPLFEATAKFSGTDNTALPVIRRELSDQARNFINGASALMGRARKRRFSSSKILHHESSIKAGVTVFFFQEAAKESTNELKPAVRPRRRNLKRTDK